MFKRLAVGAALIAFLLFLVIGIRYWFMHTVEVPFHYCVEAEFTVLPKDDKLLEAWLSGQNGVVPDSVVLFRSGKKLQAKFIQVQTTAGEPPFPDLDGECQKMGYRGAVGPFMDCEN